jgi:hypothetical protein
MYFVNGHKTPGYRRGPMPSHFGKDHKVGGHR